MNASKVFAVVEGIRRVKASGGDSTYVSPPVTFDILAGVNKILLIYEAIFWLTVRSHCHFDATVSPGKSTCPVAELYFSV